MTSDIKYQYRMDQHPLLVVGVSLLLVAKVAHGELPGDGHVQLEHAPALAPAPAPALAPPLHLAAGGLGGWSRPVHACKYWTVLHVTWSHIYVYYHV